jgi:hypothetical protein
MILNLSLRHCLYWVLFLVTFLPEPIFPQVFSELDYLKINSYLLNRNYDVLNRFFKTNDSLFAKLQIDPEDLKIYQDIKERYMYLKGYFDQIDSLPEDACETKIIQYLLFEEAYMPEKAGEYAHSYYLKFLSQVRGGAKRKAIKYYTLAYDGKIHYLNQLSKTILSKIEDAEKLIEKKDFKSAEIVLSSIEIEKTVVSIDEILEQKIDSLRHRARDGLINEESTNRFIRYEEILRRKYSIQAGIKTFIYSHPVDELHRLYLRTPYSNIQYQYDFDGIKSRIGVSFTFDLNYYILPKIRMGFGYEYGKNYHQFKNYYSLFSSYFDVNYSALNLSAVYLFRASTGYRPFLGAGFRYIFMPDEISLPKTTFHTSFIAILTDFRNEIPQLCLNFGFEFVNNPKSHFVGEFYIQAFHTLVETEIVGNFGINLGLKLGVIL